MPGQCLGCSAGADASAGLKEAFSTGEASKILSGSETLGVAERDCKSAKAGAGRVSGEAFITADGSKMLSGSDMLRAGASDW